MSTKYIFVTGGVVSGLGKGISAASLGRLLKSRLLMKTSIRIPTLPLDVSIGMSLIRSVMENILVKPFKLFLILPMKSRVS